MISRDKLISEIQKRYSEEDLIDQLNEQIQEYLDDDWEEDGYDDEFNWYNDHCNNEAEEDIINQLIGEIIDDPSLIDVDEYCYYSRAIKDTYEFL